MSSFAIRLNTLTSHHLVICLVLGFAQSVVGRIFSALYRRNATAWMVYIHVIVAVLHGAELWRNS